MTPERPNLLYIMSDQHTQRVTGCYGDRIVQTPVLGRLARRGVVFENAYTPSPLCLPARMSALTACYPVNQGCWTNSDILASDRPTMAHALGAARPRTRYRVGLDAKLEFALARLLPDRARDFVLSHYLGITKAE